MLRSVLAASRPGSIAVFDIDSTLLSNKPRQARIVREFGVAQRDDRLASCSEARIVSWDLVDTARLCGLSADEASRVIPRLRAFWLDRFFTSAYCQDDVPIAGAAAFVHRVRKTGARILYVTGRHEEMRAGTLDVFRRAGFPLPREGGEADLWLKPVLADDDDGWKERCRERLRAARPLACAFDNEPSHVTGYKLAFPDAVVVHLDTDHSGRPVEVLESIPSVVDFCLEAR